MDRVEKVELLAKFIRASKNMYVMTGAGMSTESGLPDFRSNGGLWHGVDPRIIASVDAIAPQRDDESLEQYDMRISRFHRFYSERRFNVRSHKPNAGHEILAKWEHLGFVKGIITQNVDGYHQQASSKNVIALHGNILDDKFTDGIKRPDIVLFGEDLPSFNLALEAVKDCDFMLVLGTSLEVAPANLLPYAPLGNRGRMAIVNMTPTAMDSVADLVINDTKIVNCLEVLDSILFPTE